MAEKASRWKYGLREDVLTLVEALRDVAPLLSKNGYMHIADVFAKDGLEEALRAVEAAKKNAPGDKPRFYRTGARPHIYKGYIVVRDSHVAIGLIKSAPKDLPLDLYSPEPAIWVGYSNVDLVLEKREVAMKFLKENYALLKNLPENVAELAVTKHLKGEETSEIIKRYALTCLKEGLRNVVSSTFLNRAEQLCGLTVVDSSYYRTRLRVVDLDELKASKLYKPGEIANLLIKEKPKIRWEGDLIEVLGETVSGREALRSLARLKPELAVLLPP